MYRYERWTTLLLTAAELETYNNNLADIEDLIDLYELAEALVNAYDAWQADTEDDDLWDAYEAAINAISDADHTTMTGWNDSDSSGFKGFNATASTDFETAYDAYDSARDVDTELTSIVLQAGVKGIDYYATMTNVTGPIKADTAIIITLPKGSTAADGLSDTDLTNTWLTITPKDGKTMLDTSYDSDGIKKETTANGDVATYTIKYKGQNNINVALFDRGTGDWLTSSDASDMAMKVAGSVEGKDGADGTFTISGKKVSVESVVAEEAKNHAQPAICHEEFGCTAGDPD